MFTPSLHNARHEGSRTAAQRLACKPEQKARRQRRQAIRAAMTVAKAEAVSCLGPCLITAAMTTFLGMALVHSIDTSLSLPVVRYNQDGECVSVSGPGYQRGCDEIPERYIHEWVFVPERVVYADPHMNAWVAPDELSAPAQPVMLAAEVVHGGARP